MPPRAAANRYRPCARAMSASRCGHRGRYRSRRATFVAAARRRTAVGCCLRGTVRRCQCCACRLQRRGSAHRDARQLPEGSARRHTAGPRSRALWSAGANRRGGGALSPSGQWAASRQLRAPFAGRSGTGRARRASVDCRARFRRAAVQWQSGRFPAHPAARRFHPRDFTNGRNDCGPAGGRRSQ